jgi:hypothetical protein
MNKTETENQSLERQPKYFSPETREKLSIAMKRRWARQRKAKEEEARERALAQVEETAEHAIMKLYAAAAELVDIDVLKAAIVNTAPANIICYALAETQVGGTSVQEKLRQVLVNLIAEAINR